MEWMVIGLAACAASALTLFSGFGLGTLLLPAFAFFFPAELAVAMTAVVHLCNNLFKFALLGRKAHLRTVLLFGVPAAVAAFAGAALLVWLDGIPPLATHVLLGRTLQVTSLKICLAAAMAIFALLEIWPAFARFSVPPRFLPLGGLLSGFFGGLSGHQGALRSAFLLRAGLSKEAFIGTGVVIACLVDFTRLSLYARRMPAALSRENLPLLIFAMAMAWLGAFVGSRFMHKVTLRTVQLIVAGLLLFIAALLASGWI
jgi:uncharacterized membrane protein YfcA